MGSGLLRRGESCLAQVVEAGDELARVEADGVGKVKELHDINPPFPAFDTGNVGLAASKPVSQFGLRELRVLPCRCQQFA